MGDPLTRLFRWHAIAFVAVNAALNAINLATGAPWWAFWPLAGWGLLFGLHYLVYKTRRVDPQWVEERTEDVRSKAYDRGHIDSIESRYEPGAAAPPAGKGAEPTER
jgi:hypothetical protein